MFNRVMVCVALVVVAMCVSAANATLFVNEQFNYANGPLVPNDSWTTHSGTTGQMQVNGGKAQVVQVTNSEDANKPIGATQAAGQTFYAAFDVNVSASAPLSGTTTSNYFAHFMVNNTTFRAKIFTVADVSTGRDYTYMVSTNANTPTAAWPTGFLYGSTQRVVASYEFDTGTSSLWINPTVIGDPSISATEAVALGGAVMAFGLREASTVAGANPTQTVDNLCIGDNFLDALNCTPEPGTAGLLVLGALGLIRRRR